MKINPFLLPNFGIPQSCNTVSVSIIDTTVAIAGIPGTTFYTPEIVGNKYLAAPSCKFLTLWTTSTNI